MECMAKKEVKFDCLNVYIEMSGTARSIELRLENIRGCVRLVLYEGSISVVVYLM